MISSWSAKRKLLYGGGFVLFLAIITFSIFWKAVYRAPTCNDGVKNGDETGIDCGGSCQIICTTDTLNPIILWSKAFNISGNVYNLSAYVNNPNTNSSNPLVSYEFKVYDENNVLLGNRVGQTFIPKNKKFVVFEPGFVIENKKPKRVDFQFTSFSAWQKDETVDPKLSISHSVLLSTSTSPRVEGTVTNASSSNINSLELVTTILDSNENTIAVSRTFVDNLIKNSSQNFVFTWPKPFDLGVEACSLPVDVMLVLDRSGSMRSESVNPPEPFTTVKNTAKDFIQSLTLEDSVGVVSFGTESVLESGLSSDKQNTLGSIDKIDLSTSSAQTNIAEGLSSALKEVTSNQDDAKKVIIMLTDGQPTEPTKQNEPDYPKTFAQSVAKNIVNSQIEFYTIGLGSEVSDSFLRGLVVDSNHYFRAPTKENLSSIYKSISSSICAKRPAVVNVIYRIIPTNDIFSN